MSALWTVAEAAEALRIHPTTVRRLLRQGRLPGVRVGDQWRVPQSCAEPGAVRPPALPKRRRARGRMARLVQDMEA